MKKHRFLFFFWSAVLTFTMLTAPAYANNYYVSGNVGWTLSNDLNVNDTNENVLGKLPLKSGLNLQGAFGTRFDNYRIEGELSYQKNAIDLIGVDRNFKVTSLLVNGYYDFRTSGIEPYLTAGVGGARISPSDFTIGEKTYTSSEDITKLAYQFGAGLSIPICICKCSAIDVRYRYFATTEISEGKLIKYAPSTNSILLGLRIGF